MLQVSSSSLIFCCSCGYLLLLSQDKEDGVLFEMVKWIQLFAWLAIFICVFGVVCAKEDTEQRPYSSGDMESIDDSDDINFSLRRRSTPRTISVQKSKFRRRKSPGTISRATRGS